MEWEAQTGMCPWSTSTFETSAVDVLPWTCRSEGKRPSRYTRGKKVIITSGLHLGLAEVLTRFRHYLRAQSQRHHAIDHLEERGVERGSARRSALKGRERAIVNQTNIGTASTGRLDELLRDGVERMWALLSP